MRIFWFLPNNLSILTLKMLESLPIPVIYVGRGYYSREYKSWRRAVFPLLTEAMFKTARYLCSFLTMIVSWE